MTSTSFAGSNYWLLIGKSPIVGIVKDGDRTGAPYKKIGRIGNLYSKNFP